MAKKPSNLKISSQIRHKQILDEYYGFAPAQNIDYMQSELNVAENLRSNKDWRGFNKHYGKKLKKQSALGQLRLLIAAIKEQIDNLGNEVLYDFFDREAINESTLIKADYPLSFLDDSIIVSLDSNFVKHIAHNFENSEHFTYSFDCLFLLEDSNAAQNFLRYLKAYKQIIRRLNAQRYMFQFLIGNEEKVIGQFISTQSQTCADIDSTINVAVYDLAEKIDGLLAALGNSNYEYVMNHEYFIPAVDEQLVDYTEDLYIVQVNIIFICAVNTDSDYLIKGSWL